MSKPESCVVFAALGPNPAPLTELLWKLARDGRFSDFEIHLVVEANARPYLDGEVLAPRQALDQLRKVLGQDILLHDPVVHEARDAASELLQDDADPEAMQRYEDMVWQGAREAIAAAGERPVVFGLVAGRRRTMTALQSGVFQLLARPQDLMFDVRVSDPRVEGGTGFFFPEQPQGHVRARRSDDWIEAQAVQVNLVALDLPRLRVLLGEDDLVSPACAKAATRRELDNLAPPQLKVDLHKQRFFIDGEPMKITRQCFVWFAYLAACRQAGQEWVVVKEMEPFRRFLTERCATTKWWRNLRENDLLRHVEEGRELKGEEVTEEHFRTTRSRVSKDVRALIESRRTGLAAVVPVVDRRQVEDCSCWCQRLPLGPTFIEVVP